MMPVSQREVNKLSIPEVVSLFSGGSKNTERLAADPKGPLGLNLLYASAEALVDFIFVHGLGGGSRKTWSKTTSEEDFWPQEWLPQDLAFTNVRIHSFGYDSDWARGKVNILNIHHFGKSLLGQISTLPCLRDADTPIVLIGHSMGGLVIKKAYNLARQSANCQSLAKRVHSMYFLATPHRGSDSAKLLSDILQFASISREYVAELKQDSGTIQAISDDFRNYERDLDLWSFYETFPLSMGKIFSRIIVPPDSAVMGFRDENQMPMNANHRSICKFDSIADPNYQILRNSLETTVIKISKTVRASQRDLRHSQLKDLENYLGVLDNFDSDLTTAQEARLSGTCEWFSTKDTFLDWKNFGHLAPTVLWIGAKPAAGKSILAGYALDHLRNENGKCSFFFFKYGDKSKSRLGACLRSLAFQMACSDFAVRQKLLEMQRDNIKFDGDNERTIWRVLFISGIFKTTLSNHYWIIDALDECVNPRAFFDLILDNFESVPLRVLITSRITGDIKENFESLSPNRYQFQQISTADTLPDIKLLVQSKAKAFRLQNDDDRTALVERILQKSNGSFLWTVLVVNELSKCYSQEDINQVFDDVPSDMKPWYQRTLEIMSQNTHGLKLAGAILIWATCATRPISLVELDIALKLDGNETSQGLEQTITALCGQLVAIDRFDRIQMVHETAREFLLDVSLKSELAIKPMEAHTRISKACLTYLTGDELKPPRTGRCQSGIATNRGGFSQYAYMTFSYHLANADPRSNELLSLVDKFLKLNVLSWIEIIAQTQDLLLFIHVARHLQSYLSGCSTERSPLSREVSLIRGWTTDLIRITAKFADALVLLPSAIYSLILPFCPTSSSVYKTANNRRRLAIVGLSNSHWDDRIACIDFNQGRTSAINAGDQFLAVGLTNGTIILYHAASYQEYRSLNHGEVVIFLQFKEKSDLMASCGIKNIKIWDIRRGEIVHSFQAPRRPINLTFDQDLLMAASNQNSLATWDLANDGARNPDIFWNDTLDQTTTKLRRPPRAIAISVSHQMMAVAYSGKPILLWDLAGKTFYGNCGSKCSNGKTTTHPISALVFNPNVNVGLLAVSYLDGYLAVLDPFNDQEQCGFRANCHSLTASSDGRLLAGGAGSGIIQVYEFNTLRLLYSVKSSNFYIQQLAFSPDGLHFADIRGSQCNVWEPAVLLSDIVGDDSTVDSSNSVVEAILSDSKVRISAMILHQNLEVAFCGTEDGSVSVYSVRSGVQMGTLYCHKILVRILTWWKSTGVIMSVDTSNTISAWKLQQDKPSSWKVDTQLFECRLDVGSAITQVLQGEAAGKFILSTRYSDHLWSIAGHEEKVLGHSEKPRIRKWIQHPQSPLHIICIDGAYAKIYMWYDWSEVTCVCLDIDVDGLQLKSIFPFTMDRKPQVLLEMSVLNGSANTQKLYSFDASLVDVAITNNTKQNQNNDSTNASEVAASLQSPMLLHTPLNPRHHSQIEVLADYVSHIIGISESGKLVFLDTRSWVCSVSLESTLSSSISYSRHFFVPYDWFSGTRDIVCGLARRDVIFARNDNVAIIKGGLEYVEMVDVRLEPPSPKGGLGLGFGRSFTRFS